MLATDGAMERVVPAIVCISGRMRSGKSTISKALASKLNWKRASFGEFVLEKAKACNADFKCRAVLQKIGTHLIESGWQSFVSAVLDSASWNPGEPLIIDGLRHVDAIAYIIELTKPTPLYLVYVDVDESIRQHRLSETEKFDPETEDHLVEFESKSSLKELANLVICGSKTPQIQIERILKLLETASGPITHP